MGDTGSAPGGGYRWRALGTARRKVIAGAVVVLAAVVAGVLLGSGPSGVTAGTAHPAASANDRDLLYDVSCPSRGFCVAVGNYVEPRKSNRTLVESWDGSRWSIVPSANIRTGSQLNGVSCMSRDFCVAVGMYSTGIGHNHTLIELWNGARWSIAPSPADGTLQSVACASASFCAAVGHYHNDSAGRTQAVLESWDGARWSTPASFNTPSTLASVSCMSVRACTAVGNYTRPSLKPLIESWDGSRWTAATPGPFAGDQATMTGVSCTVSGFCAATGYRMTASSGGSPIQSPIQPLVASWNGSQWSVAAAAQPAGTAPLFDVSCAGSADCTAIGWYRQAKGLHPLIESWNGARWSIAASPATPAEGVGTLFGVSCAQGFCIAAGSVASAGYSRSLIEQWDGAGWSIAASPNE